MRLRRFRTHRLLPLGAGMIVVCLSLPAACTPPAPVHGSTPTGAPAPSAPGETVGDMGGPGLSLPVGQPVDVVTRRSAPWIFTPAIAGNTIAYAETAEWTVRMPGFPPPTQSGGTAADVGQVEVHALDLLTGTDQRVIDPTDLPDWKNFAFGPGWSLETLPVPGSRAPAKVCFGLVDPQYAGDSVPRLQGLLVGAAGTTSTRILPQPALALPLLRTGDVLGLPVNSPEYEAKNLGNVGHALGERFLVLTGNLQEPVAVDPAHPVLPAEALNGLSPYACWLNFYHQGEEYFRSDLPGRPPRVYDLRDGSLVDIRVDHPTAPESVTGWAIADHFAAWTVYEGSPQRQSLYLADLDRGEASRIDYRALGGDFISFGDLALSRNWLLWLEPMPGEAKRDPSGQITAYGDWQLAGYHLPDLASIRILHVVAPGENGTVQVSGDVAMLYVRDQEQQASVNYAPPPKFTTIRVVRLR